MISKLSFFITLAKEKHFGKAATKLGITQPSLSAAIKQLEDSLGVMLIKRGTRFQELTEEGQRVLEWALRITADTRTMREEMQSLKKGLTGTLRIGTIPTAVALIPELTNSFLKAHPTIKFQIYSRNSHEIISSLERFEIDIGITYLNNDPISKLTTVPISSENYCLMTQISNKNKNTKSITWSEVSNYKLCLLTEDMQNRRILEYYFAESNVSVDPFLEANSLLILFAHIQTGKWSSILPMSLAKTLIVNKNIKAIPIKECKSLHQIGIVALERDPHTPLIATLLRESKKLSKIIGKNLNSQVN